MKIQLLEPYCSSLNFNWAVYWTLFLALDSVSGTDFKSIESLISVDLIVKRPIALFKLNVTLPFFSCSSLIYLPIVLCDNTEVMSTG